MVAQGRIEDNPAETFGGYGWCRIPNLQRLYRDVLLRHFPHHVAITQIARGQRALGGLRQLPGHGGLPRAQDVPGLYTPRLPFEQDGA